MTDLLNDVDTPSDGELISRVRGGDVAAYGELFSRHRDASLRLARQLVRGPDADDLVSEAFAKVLTVLQNGGGPDVAFRAYLLTAVRRLHVDRVRSGQRLQTTDDMTPFDPGVPFQDTAVAGFESGAAAKAFASLPERWQLVLWHLEVEGQKPAEIAPLLGMSANSVSALAYRAREGLRQAFLTMHLSDISETDCRWVNEHLGAFVRKGLSKRDAGKVRSHLDGCRRCTAMYLELDEVNSNLAGIIAPLLLGAAAAGYLAASGGAAGSFGVLTLLSRAKDVVAANTSGVVAGTVSAGVAAAAVATIVVTTQTGPPQNSNLAEPGTSITTSVGSPTPGSTSGRRGLPSTVPTSTAPTPSLSATPRAVPTPSLSESPFATPLPTPTSTPSTPVLPIVLPTGASPSTAGDQGGQSTATPTATGTPGSGPSGSPGGGPTSTPSQTPTQAPSELPMPGRVIEAPVLSAAGDFVTATVHSMRPVDVLEVTLASAETTFGDQLAGTSCQRTGDRRVECEPGLSLLKGSHFGAVVSGATYGDYTVTLPLHYPAYLVSDQIEVTASIEGGGSTSSGPLTLTPSRQATYDFPTLNVSGPQAHTVASGPDGYTDSYDLTTTAALPPRVKGVRYALTGGARFRQDAPAGCTVAADAQTMACPDVADGDQVALPLAASALTAPIDADIAVSPLANIVDATPGDQDTTVHLRPGADLTVGGLTAAAPTLSGAVPLSGMLGGVRPGMTTVVYAVSGGVAFAPDDNPACTLSDPTTMTCLAPDATGTFTATVRAGDLAAPATVTITAAPAGDFDAVGDGPHSADVTVRPVNDYSFTALSETGHTLADGVDRYTLGGTVGSLPPGVDTVSLALEAPDGDDLVFATDQTDQRCHLDTTPESGGHVVCSGLASGDQVGLVVESPTLRPHAATVRVLRADPFDDPDPGNDASAAVTLLPGTHLVLTPADLGDLHQATEGPGAGAYELATTVTGLRDGVGEVRLTAGDGARVVGTGTDTCHLDEATLVCAGLANGDTVHLSVRSDTPAVSTALRLTARPGDAFEVVPGDGGSENVATGTLVPAFDFSMGALTLTGHILDGAGDGTADVYTLAGIVPDQPAGLDGATLELTEGGSFDADQPDGCTREDDTHVRCSGLADGGPVALRVRSTSTQEHRLSVALRAPGGYDDPQAANDASSVTVHPGVDLHLSALDPDNESPGNDDGVHHVATKLGGVRPGLGAVTFAIEGGATFAGVDATGCTVQPETVTCADPADGDLTFTVRAEDPPAAVHAEISARPGDPFVEVAPADNSDEVRLLPRPTYDLRIGEAAVVSHTLAGQTDRYTLRAQLRDVPAGVEEVTVSVSGAQVADDTWADAAWADGCSRVDDNRVTCTGLTTPGALELDVTSQATERHDITLTVEPPPGYDDPDTSDNSTSVSVSPAVDLRVGPLRPEVPERSVSDTYDVSTVLSGVRSGPVELTVSGDATVTDASCAVGSATQVVCADAREGEAVRLTLHPGHPEASTPVTVTAHAADAFEELEPSDNSAATTLAPDISLDSLTVLQHRDQDTQAVVAAEVSGVPGGVASVRVRLSGPLVGLGAGEVHLTDGRAGADAEGTVTCTTTGADGERQADGTYATCSRVDQAVDGRFQIVMRVAHPHGTPTDATFTILPLGVDEAGRTDNDSRTLTIS